MNQQTSGSQKTSFCNTKKLKRVLKEGLLEKATKMRMIASFAAALMLSGCATVVSGTTDDVKFETTPVTHADCTVYRSGDVVGRVHTPQTISVRRSGKPLLAVCQHGELHGKQVIESGHNWWWLGNMLFIAPPTIIVGLLIDGFSGAWRGYDDVSVTLK